MFFCKAQVAGQQISTPPTLYTASLNRKRIWSQYMDAQTQTICGTGASLRIIGFQKIQKKDKDCFSVKSYKGLDFTT